MADRSDVAGSEDARRAALRSDPTLRSITSFLHLVGRSARSPRQRERVMRVANSPVTGASVEALRLVARSGAITSGELARRLGIDQSTTSRQVRPLEEHGLVTRTVDDADRRVAWLTVTDAGRALLERVDDVALNDIAVAIADWDTADRERLAELLDRLRRAVLAVETDDRGWSVRTAAGAPEQAADEDVSPAG